MNVLGLHYGHHDSSVTLVRDGRIIASAAEERFNHQKHYSGFPMSALSYCLSAGHVSMKDIDEVAIPTASPYDDKLALILGRKSIGKLAFAQYAPEMGMKDYARFAALTVVKRLHGLVEEGMPLYEKVFPFPKSRPILSVDHHVAHAASAYYTSGFQDRCLVMTADGSGDALSMTVWLGEKGKLKKLLKIGNDGSLGYFYSMVTEALGWWIGDGEGKTMGLAPYGKIDSVKGKLDRFVPHFENGRLVTTVNFGPVQAWHVPSGTVHWHFRDSSIIKRLVKRYGAENVAAEAQRKLEEEMVPLVMSWVKETGVKYLAAAGGIFLNVKMNQRLWEQGKLRKIHIYPDAGDGGLSGGAALYCYFTRHPEKKIPQVGGAYFGPSYTDEEIEKVLSIRNIKAKKYNQNELIERVADLLSTGKIIGWVQGRMEIGPRALGNRSILMDPRKAKNKDIINARVKYREGFRPFCPSMTVAASQKYLVNPMVSAAYMVVSFDVVPKMRNVIPAVTHVDGTARPQIVTKEANPLFHRLLTAFGKKTGVEVLLNTSFNIKGDPIVCTPSDALKCFVDTGLDYLVLGNYLIEK